MFFYFNKIKREGKERKDVAKIYLEVSCQHLLFSLADDATAASLENNGGSISHVDGGYSLSGNNQLNHSPLILKYCHSAKKSWVIDRCCAAPPIDAAPSATN